VDWQPASRKCRWRCVACNVSKQCCLVPVRFVAMCRHPCVPPAGRSRANHQPASGRGKHHHLPLPLGIACVNVDVLVRVISHPICTLQSLVSSVSVLGTPPGGDARPCAAFVNLKGMHGLCVQQKAHTGRLPPYWRPTHVQATPRGIEDQTWTTPAGTACGYSRAFTCRPAFTAYVVD
jgi:hypothetical protein